MKKNDGFRGAGELGGAAVSVCRASEEVLSTHFHGSNWDSPGQTGMSWPPKKGAFGWGGRGLSRKVAFDWGLKEAMKKFGASRVRGQRSPAPSRIGPALASVRHSHRRGAADFTVSRCVSRSPYHLPCHGTVAASR